MPGKLQPDILRSSVLSFSGAPRDDLIVGGGLGEDAALIRIPSDPSDSDIGSQILVAASDPVTGAVAHAGRLLVHINANDIACKGADPSWLIVTLIVPDELGVKFIQDTMREIHTTCKEMGIAIAGGHTEFSANYHLPVLSATMLGMTSYTLSAKNIRPNDVILATGHAGLEGMSIIAHDHPQLFTGIFSPAELEEIRSWQDQLSIVRPAKILREFARYMHDPTEGGLNGALLETSQACGLGLELEENLPVHPLTVRAAQELGFSPFNLISSGMLLAVVPPESVEQATEALNCAGISSSRIAKVICGKNSVNLDAHEELWRFL